MMKRMIAILLAITLSMTLIACSNQSETQPTLESGDAVMSETVNVTSDEKSDESDDSNTDHSEKPTENSTPSTTATEETTTAEKEDAESKPTETSPPPKETETPPKVTEETAPPKETETTDSVEETTVPPETEKPKEPTETTEPETQPEDTTPVTPPSTYEIERLVAQYINQYRAAQGDTSATVLTGLSEVARYRARQLVTDFSHNSIPDACDVLKYGEYIDMTLYGGTEADSYYQGYNREAIGKGDWFGTADQMAQRIAKGFKNSSGHWAYVGSSEYSYMAVGVYYNEADDKWYCCICMSSKNYGD